MIVTLRGTRGSVGRAGVETATFGGDTSCVEVRNADGSVLVLDAGSGLVRLNRVLEPCPPRLDILLTHLHMDHIQGLGFFQPLFRPEIEVHLWGPVSSTMTLDERLVRYLSPPLFPVRLRDLPNLEVHDVRPGTFSVGPFQVTADLVIHPGPTLGYRVENDGRSLAYLPDHEPALGAITFPKSPEWTSGYDLSRDVDLLIHDFQYTTEEYRERQGWGHSAMNHTLAFASHVGAGQLVTFHHDPEHDDSTLDRLHDEAGASDGVPPIVAGRAGLTLEV